VKAVTQIEIPPAVPGEDPTYTYSVELGTIDEFLTASQHAQDWPAFKQRLAEMNHKNLNGSRSGDVVTILDGKAGYLTVNHSHEVFPGWHGGPTRSESLVPLLFGMPGQHFVNPDGSSIPHPNEFVTGYGKGLNDPIVDATVSNFGGGDGFARNWQLAHILKMIMKEMRVEPAP
jgi:hypothetical protein